MEDLFMDDLFMKDLLMNDAKATVGTAELGETEAYGAELGETETETVTGGSVKTPDSRKKTGVYGIPIKQIKKIQEQAQTPKGVSVPALQRKYNIPTLNIDLILNYDCG